MRREALVATLLLVPLLAALAPPAAAGGVVAATTIDGHTGYVGLPTNPAAATHLVIIAKGINHVAEDHVPYLQELSDLGAITAAVDYSDFDADTGAAALLAYVRALELAHGDKTVTLVSISGGAPGATLAMRAAPGLFDWLFDVEGVTNLAETYAEARAAGLLVKAADPARQQIEAECGSSPANPQCLADRSAVFHAGALGVDGVFSIHPINDGLVPYNQGVEFVAALEAARVPVDFVTVGLGSPNPDCDTPATGYVTEPAGLPYVPLIGHASEHCRDHPLMTKTMDLLGALVTGTYTPGTTGVGYVGTMP